MGVQWSGEKNILKEIGYSDKRQTEKDTHRHIDTQTDRITRHIQTDIQTKRHTDLQSLNVKLVIKICKDDNKGINYFSK